GPFEVGLGRAGRQRPGVDVDQVRDSLGHAVRRTGGHQGAVAVPHEDAVAEVLLLEQGDDVVDVGRQIGLGGGEVGAFAHAREVDGVDGVAALLQCVCDRAPDPGAEPETGDEDVRGGGHGDDVRLDCGQ